MARPVIDISLIGDKALSRKLARLPAVAQKKVVRRALRQSAKRMKPRIVAATPINTGALKDAMGKAKIRALKLGRRGVGVAVGLPERADIEAAAAKRGRQLDPSRDYYPPMVEYGTPRMAPRAFIRGTTNQHQDGEFAQIGSDIADGIIREAQKK